MARNPSAKATMEATCKQTLDATKASLTAYVLTGGCVCRRGVVRKRHSLTAKGVGDAAAEGGRRCYAMSRNDVKRSRTLRDPGAVGRRLAVVLTTC